jgi:hypothetical protein
MALYSEARDFVAILVFAVMFERNPMDAIDRIIDLEVNDPTSLFEPSDRVAQIQEALRSDEDLSKLAGREKHSNEVIRQMLAELSHRIITAKAWHPPSTRSERRVARAERRSRPLHPFASCRIQV